MQLQIDRVGNGTGSGAGREVSPAKKAELARLSELLKNNNVILLVSIADLPASQLQRIRKALRGKATVQIVKRRVLLKLFEEAAKTDKKFEKVRDFCSSLKESCGVIFSNEKVFSLVKALLEKREKKRAKAKYVIKEEISIEAGPTGLMAGPVLTELSDAGIKAGIEKGKVVIKEPFTLKEGSIISDAMANVLTRLNILPIITGVFPIAAYEKDSGILFKASRLEINIERTIAELRDAHSTAFYLTLDINYLTADSVRLIFRKAYRQAFALAEETEFVTKENVANFLAKAVMQATAVNALNEKL